MRKILSIAPIIALLFYSCSTDNDVLDQGLSNSIISEAKANENNAFTKFKVTIYNLGGIEEYTNVLSPGTYMVQKKNSTPLFVVGEPDFGEGLEAIAEDGAPGELTESLQNDNKVRSVGAFTTPVGGDGPAPLFPGGKYEFYVTAKNKDYLNFATMFVQSNDLFISPDAKGIPLFDSEKNPISGDITMYLSLWDAGTEVNQEPGVGKYQAPRQDGPNMGPDENGVVRLVDDMYSYPNLSNIIKVMVTPM